MRTLTPGREANIATAVQRLRDHDWTMHNRTSVYPIPRADEQDLADVDALLRWPEHAASLDNPEAATVLAFGLYGWLQANRAN